MLQISQVRTSLDFVWASEFNLVPFSKNILGQARASLTVFNLDKGSEIKFELSVKSFLGLELYSKSFNFQPKSWGRFLVSIFYVHLGPNKFSRISYGKTLRYEFE